MTKVPDIAKALSAVQLLIQKQGADEEVHRTTSITCKQQEAHHMAISMGGNLPARVI